MGTDTTARQNTIIWSATSALILILCGIIGWLINGKDNAILKSIDELKLEVRQTAEAGNQRDIKIMDALAKLCDRVGGVEGRVSNLEIFIQMPWTQRKDLFDNFKIKKMPNGKTGGLQ
jgi:hypothetical protein